MPGTDSRTQAERSILEVLPGRSGDLARLRTLAQGGASPVVTVVGKYNHGKSRLLNELLGDDAFEVGDKRVTVRLDQRAHNGVRWMDAPGLDADVGTEDDRHAMRAAWLESDVRLLVHAAKEGELDAAELALLHELQADGRRTRRQTLFVLSQVDQLADDAELANITQALLRQVPGLVLHPVSATRHRKGAMEGKRLLLEKSGIPALKTELEAAFARVPAARAHEAGLLQDEIRTELQAELAAQASRLAQLRERQAQQQRDFESELLALLGTLRADMLEVVNVPGPDLARVPDAPEDRFKMTPGKLERSRLQIAYSKACRALNACLIRHGVVELPSAQQTASVSLNSVIVAVMGISVKYRDDLRRIFCEDRSQARLLQDFSHYFERSSDRVTLAASLAAAENDISRVEQALAALPHTGIQG